MRAWIRLGSSGTSRRADSEFREAFSRVAPGPALSASASLDYGLRRGRSDAPGATSAFDEVLRHDPPNPNPSTAVPAGNADGPSSTRALSTSIYPRLGPRFTQPAQPPGGPGRLKDHERASRDIDWCLGA